MRFQVLYHPDALKDIERLVKTGNKGLIKKLEQLIEELETHPETGTGKPEWLKGNLSGLWSRRINQEHRLVYAIDGQKILVTVIAAYGHY